MEDKSIQLSNLHFDISKVSFATRSIQKNPGTKLLVIKNHEGVVKSDLLQNISSYLTDGDIIVVNQSGTIPSSLTGKITRTKEDIEIRLASWLETDFAKGYKWRVITFGRGDWTETTEDRSSVTNLKIGDTITFPNGLFATINKLISNTTKFIEIEFQTDISSEELWKKIYEIGRPIQYSYLDESLAIWDQQTLFSGPPASLEPPSASFQFSWKLILELIDKGIKFVPLLHSAGISSTGDAKIDLLLPLPERYQISVESAKIINQAKLDGKRVIALGTSVVRALESVARKNKGKVLATNDVTSFKISQDHKMQIVTGLISGMHVPEESHMQILLAFTEEELIMKGYSIALENGYLWHEYGDLTLII